MKILITLNTKNGLFLKTSLYAPKGMVGQGTFAQFLDRSIQLINPSTI